MQLLSGEPVMPESAAVPVTASPPARGISYDSSRLETMEKQLAELRAELRDLREELFPFASNLNSQRRSH